MSLGSRLGILSARFRRGRDEDLLREASRYLEGAEPEEILEWVWGTFAPHVALSSSFQQQSLPLLHIASRVVPEMPVLFLDTGFHFPETLSFRAEIEQLLGLRVEIVRPELGHEGFRRGHGELYRSNPDLCCHINKVEPIRQALGSLDAWVTGIRRDQTSARAEATVLCWDLAGWPVFVSSTTSNLGDWTLCVGFPPGRQISSSKATSSTDRRSGSHSTESAPSCIWQRWSGRP